jgi:uncharacterized protein (DUF924 family)
MTPENILHFWFEEIDSSLWFAKDENFDHQVRARFSDVYDKIRNDKTSAWRETAEGSLAEIIVLDQFSRNMFRDKPQSFAADLQALQLSMEAVRKGMDQKIPILRRAFIYMPYMHSEDLEVHEEAVKLFSQLGLESNLKFELKHKKIIERFGRFPHRNEILNRKSTVEEVEFLKGPNSSF